MANRIVFETKLSKPYFKKIFIDASFPKGWLYKPELAIKEVNDMYKIKTDVTVDPFEVSSAADNELGVKLSAFNLKNKDGKTVECIFQSSKKFENGGPYLDLLDVSSNVAKKDKRLRTSGNLVAFVLNGKEYPLIPRTAFYDFVYISALLENKDLCENLDNYNAFSDIWFNPDKSLNCQAEAMALYRGLKQANKLDKAMASFDEFVNEVFISR